MCEFCDIRNFDLEPETLTEFLDSGVPAESDNSVVVDNSDYLYQSDKTVEERVSAGMAYLDLEYPNHAETVNLGQLNIGSTIYCVLGQLTQNGTFWDSREYKENGWKWCIEHGFATNNFESPELTREWEKQYEARKNR